VLAAINEFEPEFLAVAFDHPKPTFRHKQYEEYKAHRPKMPDDLQPQIPIVKDITSALGIPQFEIEGYEADDLIGTLSYWLDHRPEKLKITGEILTVIVTGDKDMLQLVDDNTHVWIPGRGRQRDTEYDVTTVKEKMGVSPSQIVDMKALMGDPSDNIPGIKGIGKKTAVRLLNKYPTLDTLYQVVEVIEREEQKPNSLLKGSLLQKLILGKDSAFLSKKLAKINQDAPIDVDLNVCKVENYDKTRVVELFKELDFNSLLSLLPSDKFETDVQQALF
jgi:DNA polymerase-1